MAPKAGEFIPRRDRFYEETWQEEGQGAESGLFQKASEAHRRLSDPSRCSKSHRGLDSPSEHWLHLGALTLAAADGGSMDDVAIVLHMMQERGLWR